MNASNFLANQSLSNTKFESSVIKGTPLWDEVFNPDHDITTLRVNGLTIKVKNYFIRENADCIVFLHNEKLFIKIIITNGRIDEYESLPKRICESEDYSPVAWLFKHNKNEILKHKRIREV